MAYVKSPLPHPFELNTTGSPLLPLTNAFTRDVLFIKWDGQRQRRPFEPCKEKEEEGGGARQNQTHVAMPKWEKVKT